MNGHVVIDGHQLMIRKAANSDAEMVVELVNRAYRPAPGEGGWTHERMHVQGKRLTVEQYLFQLRRCESCLFLGFLQHIITASILVSCEDKIAEIALVAVAPAYQSKGFAATMLSHAESFSQIQWSCTTAVLWVLSARTELISYYERRGYRRTGDTADYPLDAGVGTPLNSSLRLEKMQKWFANT